MYHYQMVQIPKGVHAEAGQGHVAAATYLQGIVTQYAAQGWEFYSVESMNITEASGCGCLGFILSMFLPGFGPSHSESYVIVFRRRA